MVFKAEVGFFWACRLEILMRSHALEEVLPDGPNNELCRGKESEVVADFISFPSSCRPWWLCA